jgi:heme exporter protein C
MFAPMAALAGGSGMAASQWLIYAYAPVEEQMKLAQKIFYLHLPSAWWGLISFSVVFGAGIAYLCTRAPRWERLADAAAEIGVVFTGLALVTGSIWAKAAWWTWWKWDHRLTTTLVLWFVYATYLLLRGLDLPAGRRAVVKAVFGIVAFLDVPLVFFAARLWESSHPVGITASCDGMEPEMRLTVAACIAAMGLIWYTLLHLHCRISLLETGICNSQDNQRKDIWKA